MNRPSLLRLVEPPLPAPLGPCPSDAFLRIGRNPALPEHKRFVATEKQPGDVVIGGRHPA